MQLQFVYESVSSNILDPRNQKELWFIVVSLITELSEVSSACQDSLILSHPQRNGSTIVWY